MQKINEKQQGVIKRMDGVITAQQMKIKLLEATASGVQLEEQLPTPNLLSSLNAPPAVPDPRPLLQDQNAASFHAGGKMTTTKRRRGKNAKMTARRRRGKNAKMTTRRRRN
jgi:hypothetical protein